MVSVAAGGAGAFSIGELARRASTKVETVRWYEREGLLPAPARTAGGHRVYTRAHLDRLAFVRHARELGFDHPADGRWVTFTSPYPADLARALDLLQE